MFPDFTRTRSLLLQAVLAGRLLPIGNVDAHDLDALTAELKVIFPAMQRVAALEDEAPGGRRHQ